MRRPCRLVKTVRGSGLGAIGCFADWCDRGCLRHQIVGCAAECAPLVATQRPNIVIVLVDDVGYGDFSCHGNPVIRTPHVDGFYRQSVRFTDFHVSPTCAPTRCSLMTGRHEFKSGVTHTILERERMSLKAVTIAQVLHDEGYATGIFGKWHLGDQEPYQPEHRGFDEVFIHGAGGIGQTFPGSCGDAPGNTYFNPALMHNGKFEKTHGYCTDLFFGQALRWIDREAPERPSLFRLHHAQRGPHAAAGPRGLFRPVSRQGAGKRGPVFRDDREYRRQLRPAPRKARRVEAGRQHARPLHDR